MSQRYRVTLFRAVTVDAKAFIRDFPGEWKNAQARGLDAEAFAVESIKECDFDTLCNIGWNETDDFEWELIA